MTTSRAFAACFLNNRDTSLLRQRLRIERLRQQAKLLMNSDRRMLGNVLQFLQHAIQRLPEDSTYKEVLPDLMLLAT
jgi:hypothetical protein